MRKFVFVLFLLFSVRAFAQSFTMDYTLHKATTLPDATLVPATNYSVFTYYGFPVTNTANSSNLVTVTGISDGGFGNSTFQPIQAVFTLTGTNCELIVNNQFWPSNTWSWGYWELTDGQTTSVYTNAVLGNMGYYTCYIPVTFTDAGPHHLKFSIHGNFGGVRVNSGNAVSQYHITPKPNLLMVLGDSYTVGYDPNITLGGSPIGYWFPGWIWQLARLSSNTIAMPSGAGGTGFLKIAGITNYQGRVFSDICALYTNAVNSGLYDNIFITASGTINDHGLDTNQLYMAATSVYQTILSACPQAKVFCLGNWYASYGTPDTADTNNNVVLKSVAEKLSLPYYSPVEAKLLNPMNTGNYSVFMGKDSAHPTTYGYGVMASWLNTNLSHYYGTNWSLSATTSGDVTPLYSLTVNNGGGSGSYTNGQIVAIDAPNLDSYTFTSWSGADIADTNSQSTTVVMPASNLVVTANYSANVGFESVTNSSSSAILNPSFELGTNGWALLDGQLATTNNCSIGGIPDGTNFFYCSLPSSKTTNSLVQSFSVSSNADYYVKFWRSGKVGYSIPAALVLVDGNVVGSLAQAGNALVNFGYYLSGNFHLPSGSHTLTIQTFQGGNVFAQFSVLDNVQIFSTNVPLYSLTVANGSGSTIAPQGTEVAIAPSPVAGKHFVAWTGDIGNIANRFAATTYATISTNNLTLTPLFLSDSISTNTIDLADLGAVGDCTNFFATTTSNSVVIGTPIVWNTNTTIGKVAQVFRAGPWITYSNWGPVVTNQDIVCYITNVTDGTNLWLTIPCGWTTTNTYCVVGSNNAPLIQAGIDYATYRITNGLSTNVLINVPAGRYLILSSNVLDPNYVMGGISDTHPALVITCGGITFNGNSTNDTYFIGCGAGMCHLVVSSNFVIMPGYAPYEPMRDTMIYCRGPIAHSELPLVFQDITFDGGLTNGLQNYRYFILYQGNGEGWDTTHHCLADCNPDPYHPQMHQLKVFTNCVFQHWRGEVLINWCGRGGTNCFNDIANCVFRDGNGSAVNLYFGQHIHGCTFDGFDKVEEYYQYNATLPSVFEHNTWTNILGNPFSIVGARTNENPPSFTFRFNNMSGVSGRNQIHFAPAENVFVISNTFYGQGLGVVFSGVGVQPSDGSASIISNIVVAGNQFIGSSGPISMDGYPVRDVWISNNVASVYGLGKFLGGAVGWKRNIVVMNNSANGSLDFSGVSSGQYMYDAPNNSFGTPPSDTGVYYIYSGVNGANPITYGMGRYHEIKDTAHPFMLDDRYPDLMPTNLGPVLLTLTNAATSQAMVYSSYSQTNGETTIGSHQAMTFYWTGNGWNTNAPATRPSPPNSLRILN